MLKIRKRGYWQNWQFCKVDDIMASIGTILFICFEGFMLLVIFALILKTYWDRKKKKQYWCRDCHFEPFFRSKKKPCPKCGGKYTYQITWVEVVR